MKAFWRQTTPPEEQPVTPTSPQPEPTWTNPAADPAPANPPGGDNPWAGSPYPADEFAAQVAIANARAQQDPAVTAVAPVTEPPPSHAAPADTSTAERRYFHAPAPEPDDHTDTCPACGGKMPTDPELLQSSAALLGDRLPQVAPAMYRYLFLGAPTLIPLFEDHTEGLIQWTWPTDSLTPVDGVDEAQWVRDPDGARYWTVNPDAAQVDVVFSAIQALVQLFDPTDDGKLEQLRAALAKMGRSHLRFDPPAQWNEYGAVIDAVLATLAQFAGEAWTPRLETAWRKALEFTSGTMIAAQATAVTKGRGRRRRTV